MRSGRARGLDANISVAIRATPPIWAATLETLITRPHRRTRIPGRTACLPLQELADGLVGRLTQRRHARPRAADLGPTTSVTVRCSPMILPAADAVTQQGPMPLNEPGRAEADRRPVVLLTGGTGYVGGLLIPLLEKRGVALRCL